MQAQMLTDTGGTPALYFGGVAMQPPGQDRKLNVSTS